MVVDTCVTYHGFGGVGRREGDRMHFMDLFGYFGCLLCCLRREWGGWDVVTACCDVFRCFVAMECDLVSVYLRREGRISRCRGIVELPRVTRRNALV